MVAKKRVLWVEDSARFELANVLGPIYAAHRFDLTLAEDATTAAEYLRRREFSAIVVDIRIPPGHNRYWRQIYSNAGWDRTNAKLGLALLGWLLAGESARPKADGVEVPKLPPWPVSARQIGVFSVENRLEIGPQVEPLGVEVMYEKRPGLPDTVLLQIVSQLLDQVEHARQAERSTPDEVS